MENKTRIPAVKKNPIRDRAVMQHGQDYSVSIPFDVYCKKVGLQCEEILPR